MRERNLKGKIRMVSSAAWDVCAFGLTWWFGARGFGT